MVTSVDLSAKDLKTRQSHKVSSYRLIMQVSSFAFLCMIEVVAIKSFPWHIFAVYPHDVRDIFTCYYVLNAIRFQIYFAVYCYSKNYNDHEEGPRNFKMRYTEGKKFIKRFLKPSARRQAMYRFFWQFFSSFSLASSQHREENII